MKIWGAVVLAILCWAFTFGLAWGNFWAKIGLSVVLICGYSFYWQKPKISFSLQSAAIGLASAVVLYGIFYLGYVFLPILFRKRLLRLAAFMTWGPIPINGSSFFCFC